MLLYLLLGVSALAANNRDCKEVFSEIYEEERWGVAEDGDPSSGWGSHYKSALPFIDFIEEFLYENSIQKVVDLGCGAWEYSRYIDWTGVDYTGIDVSEKIIALNQEKFGTNHIRFQEGDILSVEFPDADLVICKDVLQHLQNADIHLFLSRIRKYKHCLLINDISVSKTDDVRIHRTNRENAWRGANRPLDLTLPPFNVEGSNVLTYVLGNHVKQVLYIKN